MNSGLKTLILSALAAGAGFAGGFFFSKNKYEGLADKEVASVKEHLTNYYEDRVKRLEKYEENDKPTEYTITPEKPISSLMKDTNKTEKDYKSYSSPYKPSPAEEDSREVLPEEDSECDIYEDYDKMVEDSTYEQHDYYYYGADSTLARENNTVVDDVLKLIGPDAKDYLKDWSSEDDEILCVKNHKLGRDIVIHYVAGPFKDM